MKDDFLNGNVYNTEYCWLPDFSDPVPKPYCTKDEAINALKQFNAYEKTDTEEDFEKLLSEYGIFTPEMLKKNKTL